MQKSHDFLKKKKGFADDNYDIIKAKLMEKFGEYVQESEKSNIVFIIPNISAGMIYGLVASEFATMDIYSDILDLHIAVLDYAENDEEGCIIRLYDRKA